MKKHISYPKIGQFRNTIYDINKAASFIRLDEEGNPIFDEMAKKPVITFSGTVKLHGTNAGVSFNNKSGIWAQSRNNIITVDKDNAGFALFVDQKKDAFYNLISYIGETYQVDYYENTITIFGEWVGKGIQKGVGISELERSFFIFGVKVTSIVDDKSYWVDPEGLRSPDNNIYNIYDYENYSIDVDFSEPQLAQNKFIEITEQVEKECPVSKAFGIHGGVGEGVVWSAMYKGQAYMFKVKGEKHSVTKVKTLINVDIEKLNTVKEFVEYAVTENRLNQAIFEVFGGSKMNIKGLGDVIRWMISDIVLEEEDTMAKNGLEPKDINRDISNKTKELFFIKLNGF